MFHVEHYLSFATQPTRLHQQTFHVEHLKIGFRRLIVFRLQVPCLCPQQLIRWARSCSFSEFDFF